MKKLLALTVAVGMFAGVASAQEVLSQNAVGYVKQEIEGDKIYLVSNPFVGLENVDGTHYMTNMLGVLPPNTIVSAWDESAQTYVNFTRDGFGDWDANAQTTTVERAKAMFIRMPPGAPADELILMGEVPADDDTFQSRVPGITFVGYPYPATENFTDTEMAQSVAPGTIVSRWDPDIGAYVNFTKDGFGDWDSAAQAAEVEAGQAFIIRSGEPANDWDEVKPYTWP